MSRPGRRIVSLLSHRLLLPAAGLVCLFSYIAVAFFADEALVTLVQLVSHNPFALGLLGLVVGNILLGMITALDSYRLTRSAVTGNQSGVVENAFSQSLTVNGRLDTGEIGRILAGAGYRVTRRDGFIAGVRGISLICPRLLWRLSLVLLFAGLALSFATRTTLRLPVIEGETLPVEGMAQRQVARIVLEDTPGHWFLQRRLAITTIDAGGGQSTFGIYPPGMLAGRFLYPRYPGIAPLLRFSIPKAGEIVEGYQLIMLYPPGREDRVELPDGYRAQVAILQHDGMADPFVSGRFDLHVKLLHGDALVAEGDLPFGGRFEAKGFSVSLLDAKRFVVTDIVRDYGVLSIWLAIVAALAAFLLYLPLRLFWPQRLLVFTAAAGTGQIFAGCRYEGKKRQHLAIYHDLLDRIYYCR
jgi:hypothetical protein